MVEFDLSEEQEMLSELARDFADQELIPNAEEWDRNGIFPGDAIDNARELGLLNCTIPVEYGGLGLSFLDEVIINEELVGVTRGLRPSQAVSYTHLRAHET